MDDQHDEQQDHQQAEQPDEPRLDGGADGLPHGPGVRVNSLGVPLDRWAPVSTDHPYRVSAPEGFDRRGLTTPAAVDEALDAACRSVAETVARWAAQTAADPEDTTPDDGGGCLVLVVPDVEDSGSVLPELGFGAGAPRVPVHWTQSWLGSAVARSERAEDADADAESCWTFPAGEGHEETWATPGELVPAERALAAAREWVRTGERPEGVVDWEDL